MDTIQEMPPNYTCPRTGQSNMAEMQLPMPRAIFEYNRVPDEIKRTNSLNAFKVKKHNI